MTYIVGQPFQGDLMRLNNKRAHSSDDSSFHRIAPEFPLAALFVDMMRTQTTRDTHAHYKRGGAHLSVLRQSRPCDEQELAIAAYAGLFPSPIKEKPTRLLAGATVARFFEDSQDFGDNNLETLIYPTPQMRTSRLLCTQDEDQIAIQAHLSGAEMLDYRIKELLAYVCEQAEEKGLAATPQYIEPKPVELSLLPNN